MRGFPITPDYSIPVNGKYNMLDAIDKELKYWTYSDYIGSFSAGADYSGIDSTTKLYKFFENGERNEVTDEKVVKEWICRQKLFREIQNIREHGIQSAFDVEVESMMTVASRSSSSDTVDGEQVWKSIGEVMIISPLDQCKLDDEKVVRTARTIGANRFADAYIEYITDYEQRD